MIKESRINTDAIRILEDLPVLSYLYDLNNSHLIYSSPEILTELGLKADEINQQGTDLFREVMHPDDYEEYMNYRRNYSDLGKNEWLKHTIRLKSKSGEWVKLRVKKKIHLRNPDKSPRIILGLIEKMETVGSQAKPGQYTGNNTRITIITDLKGEVINGNQNYYRLAGGRKSGRSTRIFSLISRENHGDFKLKFKNAEKLARTNQHFMVGLKGQKDRIYLAQFDLLDNADTVLVSFIPSGQKELLENKDSYYLKFENTIAELSREFLNTPNSSYDISFRKYLKEIGLLVNADLGCFYVFDENMKVSRSCINQITNTGNRKKDIDFSPKNFPGILKSLQKGESFIYDQKRVSRILTPSEKAGLESFGYEKAIFIPMCSMDKLMGFIVFAGEKNTFNLDEKIESYLQLLANIYTNILIKLENEQSLLKTEERYLLATEASGVGIWDWKVGSEFVFYSDIWKHQLGYQPHELENSFSTWQSLLHPDDYERMHKEMDSYMNNPGKFFNAEFRLKHKDGVYRWIKNKASAILDEKGRVIRMFGAHQDITAIKEYELELNKLLQAIHQSPMPLVITSIEGVIEFVNPVFTSLTGYDKSEVIGQNARIMASGQLKISHYRKLWDTILAGKTWKGEFINRKKNGDIYWELASISPILNDSGEILNFVKICEDITHIKKLEKDLKEAKDKAEAANIHKNNFLANISHEIRTPMNGITGFAELLKKPNLNAEMKNKYVNIINNSSQTLLTLIDDIIDISKIEAGEIRLNKKEVHIRELLIDLHTLYNRIKHERKRPRTEIRLNMPPLDHSPVILTDQHRLRQILNNLINNALKFTENGSVEFGYNIRNDKLEFFIKDTGIGIQEGKQDLIFTRFRQVDENIARKYGGTGLGLAISKGLVELLDGKIWLKSKPGKGTTFYFTIPYISANHIEEEIIKPTSISESRLEGRTALVVEDDDVNFEFLLAVLEDEGMKITRASDGVEAVEIYTENPGFDFVLMDINLPRKNGLEASREIMAENHNQIIIAQTAYAMQEEIEKCLQSGCIDYVTKPIKPKILVNKLLKYSEIG